MLFNSYTFIIFFFIVLTFTYSKFNWKIKKYFLLVASYIFYTAWNPPFVLLLWTSTIVDWHLSKKIYRCNNTFRRKIFLILSLVVNLGFLCFFKYTNFLLENFIYVLSVLNISFEPINVDIILPVGISFYTFQTLSYTIDIYRGKGKPWHSFLDFALFVTFFPQLVAGPIVRAFHFLPQLNTLKKYDINQLSWGLTLFLIGLFQKIVVADGILAPTVEKIYDSHEIPSFIDAWTGTLAFSGQIFCDFSGYSSCAIGIALCLGFNLPTNFKFPYAAIGFSDFWNRWHISLSSWLRDYLYIPLGGNRKGVNRTYANLMMTMLIGGLWHGASWTFVFWGGLHGLYLILERLLKRAVSKINFEINSFLLFILSFLTFILNCFAWIFFRSNSFDQAINIFHSMFDITAGGSNIEMYNVVITIITITILLVFHWFLRDTDIEDFIKNINWKSRVILLTFILVSICTISGEDRAFIYFQF